MSGDVTIHVHAGSGAEVKTTQVAEEDGCPHQHEGDPTVRPCPNPEVHESAPVVYEAPRRGSARPRVASLPKSKRRTSLASSPLASAAGAAVGTMVAGVLAAEEGAGECLPWVKIERDPARYDECLKMGQKIGPIDTPRKVYDLLHGEFDKRDQETLVVVGLNVRGELRTKPIEVAYGQRSKVAVGINDIMRAALVSGAEMICIAHAHPSGNATPSKADRDLTKAVEKACETCEIVFADHVVIGARSFHSIKEGKTYKI